MATDRKVFEQWATRAMKGVVESATFLQMYTPSFDPRRDPEYALQLGVAILLDRPILIIAPNGTVIPPRLLAIAASVQYYVDGDLPSIEHATRRALEAIGVVKH